jgi:tRNA-specific 2-thiouridylase
VIWTAPFEQQIKDAEQFIQIEMNAVTSCGAHRINKASPARNLHSSSRKKKPKALVLLSGGLDSMLAAKLVLDQGIEVEAVHFVNPFSSANEAYVDRFCQKMGIKLHKVILGQEMLDIVVNPQHGYGSRMNPCLDCRILAFRKAVELAEQIKADFYVTGEVLNERPFSQRKAAMLLIQKEAGLEGKILRPLSAKLLPETEPEKRGMVDRKNLLAFSGRRRTPQMVLAKELGINEYPNPAGGCLLTDPRFADRLREHLKHEGKLTAMDVALLKIGRHFRVGKAKVVVGRNEEENNKLLLIAGEHSNLTAMEVSDYMGPVTIVSGKANPEIIHMAAGITVCYSDAPMESIVAVNLLCDAGKQVIHVRACADDELKSLSI